MHTCKTLIALAALAGLLAGACATTGGGGYEELAAEGVDVFAGKAWNAPRRNNMYDRWEFNTDGTFHFRHVHLGEPLDRGLYRYEAKDGTLTVTKVDDGAVSATYTYTFSGRAFTITPLRHGSSGHGSQGGHQMGALPETETRFSEAK